MTSSLSLTVTGLFIYILHPFSMIYFDSPIKPVDFWSLFMKWMRNADYLGCLEFVQHTI